MQRFFADIKHYVRCSSIKGLVALVSVCKWSIKPLPTLNHIPCKGYSRAIYCRDDC